MDELGLLSAIPLVLEKVDKCPSGRGSVEADQRTDNPPKVARSHGGLRKRLLVTDASAYWNSLNAVDQCERRAGANLRNWAYGEVLPQEALGLGTNCWSSGLPMLPPVPGKAIVAVWPISSARSELITTRFERSMRETSSRNRVCSPSIE